MTGGTAQSPGILVMHFALHHPTAPSAGFGRDGRTGRRAVGDLRRQRPVGQRPTSYPFDRDAQKDEVDVGITGRALAPLALEDEGAEPVGIAAISVDRL